MHPSVSIVILNFNGRNYLEKFLPSVLASTYPNKKIVLADNASSDDSVQFVRDHFASIEIIINSSNQGFAGGYNWALSQVESDYYVLLNSDVDVTPNWIEPIIFQLENDSRIAAAQPKLLCYDNPEMFEYAGASGGWIDILGYPFSRGRIFDHLEKDLGQYNSIQEIFWASGAAMFVRSQVFHQLKGFDEFFFAHQEEIDLCWRMQLLGYKIIVCPDSIVYHVGAGTLPRGGRKVFLNFRNNLIMLLKNLPNREKYWKIPLRFTLDAISAWKGLLAGDIGYFKAIVRAHYRVVVWYFKNSSKTSTLKNLKSLSGVYQGSIIWQHFVAQRNSFAQIIENKPH